MSNLDWWITTITLLSILLFGIAAVFALSWSVKSGQFQNVENGATAIFDADEPIGETTDRFPDCPPKQPQP